MTQLCIIAKDLVSGFKDIKIEHVYWEFNTQADLVGKQAIQKFKFDKNKFKITILDASVFLDKFKNF